MLNVATVGAVTAELGKELLVNNSVSEEMVSNKQSRPHFEQLELMAPSDSCIAKSEESRWIHIVIECFHRMIKIT